MNNLRKASLVLKGCDLTPNVNNQYGYTDTLRTTMTWNNVNLRSLLGDMYDQYDYFNISLNSIASATAGAISADKNNLCLSIRMSGLAWSNCSYNVKTETNCQYAILAPIIILPSNVTLTQYNNSFLTFGKNSDVTTITIDYIKISDNARPVPTSTYPSINYYFDIVGIPKTLYLTNN